MSEARPTAPPVPVVEPSSPTPRRRPCAPRGGPILEELKRELSHGCHRNPRHAGLHRQGGALRRAQLRAGAGGGGPCQGLPGLGRGGQGVHRHDERVLLGQPWPPAPAHRRGGAPPAGAGGGDVPRLLQHHARGPAGETEPGHRFRARAADEHRRRGGGDRDQVRAPLGPSRQGHRRRQQRILVARGNFHGRTSTIVGFSSEQEYRSGFGPFCGGFQPLRLRRHGERQGRSHPEHLRRADRAHPGRGRRAGAAARLLPGSARLVHRERHPADRRRGAGGPGAHRQVVRLRARGHPSRRADPGQGAGRRPAAGERLLRRRRGDVGVRSQQPRLHLRRQRAGGSGGAGRPEGPGRGRPGGRTARRRASTCSSACARCRPRSRR